MRNLKDKLEDAALELGRAKFELYEAQKRFDALYKRIAEGGKTQLTNWTSSDESLEDFADWHPQSGALSSSCACGRLFPERQDPRPVEADFRAQGRRL